jgi:hypothetical protein
VVYSYSLGRVIALNGLICDILLLAKIAKYLLKRQFSVFLRNVYQTLIVLFDLRYVLDVLSQ